MQGKRLGPYEIVAKLGAGGMGEVYRAVDTSLGRDVALKMLPADSVADPSLVERLRREARVLAGLNHSGIATLYGFHEEEGVCFLSMELVDGESLAERLHRPLSIDEAMRIARGIVGALDAAHRAGVVHRDLKPANVLLPAEGGVKLVDFGIARRFDGTLHSATTARTRLTEAGMLVGTVPYMSPEQMRGGVPDHRSDLWALGCTLFECLTGRSPFGRQTVADTIAAILEAEPAWHTLPPGTPKPIRQVLARCLTPDPTRRGQSAAEIAACLEDIPGTGRGAGPSRAALWLPIGVVAIALAGIYWATRPAIVRQPALGEIRRVTSLPGAEGGPVFSPDGAMIAFSSSAEGNRDIWVKRIDGGEAVQITRHPAEDDEPDYSPDGRWIAFQSRRDGGGIYVVPSLGGDAVRVADRGFRPRWAPSGDRILFQQRRGLLVPNEIYVVDFPATAPARTLVPFTEGGEPTVMAEWSPDGRFIAALHGGYRQPWGWSLFSARGARISALGGAGQIQGVEAAWLPDARGLVVDRGREIRFVPLDGDGLVSAPSIRLATSGGQPRISADGTRLVYRDLTTQDDIWRVPLDPETGLTAGDPERITDDRAADWSPLYVPSLRRVAFISDRAGAPHLYSAALDGSDVRVLDRTRLWSDDVSFYGASPDGRWIFWANWLLPIDPVTGLPGQPMQLPDFGQEGETQLGSAWAPDSRRLGVWTPSLRDAGLLAILEEPWSEAGRLSYVELDEDFRAAYPYSGSVAFTADGRWLVFMAYRERHRPTVFILRAGTTTPIPIFEGGSFVRPTPHPGRILMLREGSGESEPGFVEIDPETGSVVRGFTPLAMAATPHGAPSTWRWTMTPDLRWLYFQFTELEGDVYVADLVWPD